MTIFRDFEGIANKSDRTARDRRRHRAKIKESIKDNIHDIIAEESIIGQSTDTVIKIPVKSIKEFRFIFGENNPEVSKGDGSQKPGDVVGEEKKEAKPGDESGDGEAGAGPGADAIETEVTIEELIDIMFEDLELPDLERKALKQMSSNDSKRKKGIRKAGIKPRLNKKESAKNRIKRKIASAENINSKERFPFHKEDMRYFHLANTEKETSSAVVICIMDTSGSMGTVKKYLARSFYFLLFQFLKKKYENVEICFIAHHTEAKEVNENDFFHKVESGGTYISSGYLKALEIIEKKYHPSLWNIYAFHCSDGDNFYSDNDKTVEAAKELCKVCNLFGYGEIKPNDNAYYSGTMIDYFKDINEDNFYTAIIKGKENLWDTFKSFLTKENKIEQKSNSSQEELL